MTFFSVNIEFFTETCTIRSKDTVLAANHRCTEPYPVGRRNWEQAFHHTPDVAMGSIYQPHMIYMPVVPDVDVRPPMTLLIGDEQYNIRAVNRWPGENSQFLEILTDEAKH